MGLKSIKREANDWAADGAAGGGVTPGGGVLAGWLFNCGCITAAATGGGTWTWGGKQEVGGGWRPQEAEEEEQPAGLLGASSVFG